MPIFTLIFTSSITLTFTATVKQHNMCSEQKGPQLGDNKSQQQHLQLVKHLQFTS